MMHTYNGVSTRKIRRQERLIIGSREGNLTSQRHFQVEYPKDIK